MSEVVVRAHARLSASESKRWTKCPGSVALLESMPEELRRRSSDAAEQGTAAHFVVETCLERGLWEADWLLGQKVVLVNGDAQAFVYPDAEAKPGERLWEVDHDMVSAVNVMLETVRQKLEEAGPGAELKTETRFDLSWLRPDMGGTGDVSISQFMGRLFFIDYKHGKGVTVEVQEDGEGNTQLLYYALAAAHAEDFLHEDVEITVVQPRKEHADGPVRSFAISVKDLREWGEWLGTRADVVAAAKRAHSGLDSSHEFAAWAEEFLQAGPWCTFCDAKVDCPAFLNKCQEEALADFFGSEPETLEPPSDLERLAKLLEWAPMLDSLVKAAKDRALTHMRLGVQVPRHKIVQGKANRKWTLSEHEVLERLEAFGVERERAMTEPKLLTPAKVEKLSPAAKMLVTGKAPKTYKGEVPEDLVPLAAKGAGKLALVHESDPREAVSIDVASDFEGAETEDDASDE